jgi:hypothetical protein
VCIGKAARMRVEREFTWSTVAQRTAALYETLLVRKSRAAQSACVKAYVPLVVDIPGLSGGGE